MKEVLTEAGIKFEADAKSDELKALLPEGTDSKETVTVNVLVNENKKKRAEDIVRVLDGEKPKELQKNEIAALKATCSELVKEEDVPKGDRLEFIYTKLGGLVRTEEEHKEAEKLRKETKKDYDKRMKEEDERRKKDE